MSRLVTMSKYFEIRCTKNFSGANNAGYYRWREMHPYCPLLQRAMVLQFFTAVIEEGQDEVLSTQHAYRHEMLIYETGWACHEAHKTLSWRLHAQIRDNFRGTWRDLSKDSDISRDASISLISTQVALESSSYE